MEKDSSTIAVVREWIYKADNDLKNASHTLKISKGCPTDTICFHAQQCVEKYLKAFLVSMGTDFPKTHDIERLVILLPGKIWLKLSVMEQRLLTNYATATRYPGNTENISPEEAKQSVKIARRVRKELRGFLPKDALKVKRR